MKKTYTKPYIAVESFQLDAAIAAACSSDPNKIPLNYGMNSCTPIEENPGDVFLGLACENNGGFDIVQPGGDPNDNICYQGPVPTSMYMNS